MKPGHKTTELWASIAAAVGAIGASAAGLLPPREAAILTTISGVAYAISRGLAKNGSTNA